MCCCKVPRRPQGFSKNLSTLSALWFLLLLSILCKTHAKRTCLILANTDFNGIRDVNVQVEGKGKANLEDEKQNTRSKREDESHAYSTGKTLWTGQSTCRIQSCSAYDSQISIHLSLSLCYEAFKLLEISFLHFELMLNTALIWNSGELGCLAALHAPHAVNLQLGPAQSNACALTCGASQTGRGVVAIPLSLKVTSLWIQTPFVRYTLQLVLPPPPPPPPPPLPMHLRV